MYKKRAMLVIAALLLLGLNGSPKIRTPLLMPLSIAINRPGTS
jgi:hypothetical protein